MNYQTNSSVSTIKNLNINLKSSIFGQNNAINQVVDKIMISSAGLSDTDKPIASFLFTGPTGVGKTELAKELAKNLNIHFERFDMSEYSSKHGVSTLIGGEKSLVGYEEGGLLTNAIKKYPNCLLLLDEIEKADKTILNTFLQVFDYGILTDKKGNKIDFRKVIIIMTSNLGATVKSSVGFGSNSSSNKEDEINDFLSPEFRARIDTKIEFNLLNKEMVNNITNKFLEQLLIKLNNQYKTMILTPQAFEEITAKAFKSNLGARYISKIINETIKQKLAYELLFGDFINNNQVTIDFNNDFEYNFDNSQVSIECTDSESNRFRTAQDAQEYAKNNPGVIITQAKDGFGFIIKEKENIWTEFVNPF